MFLDISFYKMQFKNKYYTYEQNTNPFLEWGSRHTGYAAPEPHPEEEKCNKEDNILRIWAKLFADNHMLRDTVVEDTGNDTRTHKVFHALEEVCHQFDLGQPIWLESNVSEFQHHAKTRFYQDSFIEAIDFDYLELHIIEED